MWDNLRKRWMTHMYRRAMGVGKEQEAIRQAAEHNAFEAADIDRYVARRISDDGQPE